MNAYKRLCMALIVAIAAASSAWGADVYLVAAPFTKSIQVDGVGTTVDVHMWGYGVNTDPTFGTIDAVPTSPGPAIVVPPGDTTLTIHLYNNGIPEGVSVMIPGLPKPTNPATFTDGQARTRARAFDAEVSSGNWATYTWNNVRPGSYIYHSASHPALQVQMGLYGQVTKDASLRQAYAGPASAYIDEVSLFYSEIDKDLHDLVQIGGYDSATMSTIDYTPDYFLINGEVYPVSTPIAHHIVRENELTLVRFFNAGLRSLVPIINNAKMQIIAEDAHMYPYPMKQYSSFIAAGKTRDVLISIADAGMYTIYERRFSTTNAAASPGGMITSLEVIVNEPPVAVDDSYATDEDITLVTASVDGVLFNDLDFDPRLLEAILDTSVSNGTLTLNADGSFTYIPTPDWNGVDSFTYFTSDLLISSVTPATATITVNPVNDAPVLNLATLSDHTITEDQLLGFTVGASDVDIGDALNFSTAAPLPTGASIDAATGAFSWRPAYDQAGSYPITITVTDDGTPVLGDAQLITITVTDKNRAPSLDPVGDQTVLINATLAFSLTATDPDLDGFTFSGSLPSGATLDSVTGAFSWTPTQAGIYAATFTVTDDGTPNLSSSEAIVITVGSVNKPPVLAAIGDQSATVAAELTFTITATDPDAGDTVSYSAGSLPAGAVLDAVTGVFSWTPSAAQADSSFVMTFQATDDGAPPLSDNESVTITVGAVANQPPVMAPLGSYLAATGDTLNIGISAIDPEGGVLTYAAFGLPPGATFDAATQTFTWAIAAGQEGVYQVLFTVTDDGMAALTASELVTITVGDAATVNRPPVLDPIGWRSVNVDAQLTIVATAIDPDGDSLSFTAGNVPVGATFDAATQTFSWMPVAGQEGLYEVIFAVADGGTPPLGDYEIVTIAVGTANLPPAFAPIGPQAFEIDVAGMFTVTASDPDGDAVTLSVGTLPTGADFNVATGMFTWTPTAGQEENYVVTFTATDDSATPAASSIDVLVTVGGGNRPPVFSPVGDLSVVATTAVEFTVLVSDLDGDTVTIAAQGLPTGATFDAVTQVFAWTPTATQLGDFTVTFDAADDGAGALTDTMDVTITVTDAPIVPPDPDPVPTTGGGGGGGCFIMNLANN